MRLEDIFEWKGFCNECICLIVSMGGFCSYCVDFFYWLFVCSFDYVVCCWIIIVIGGVFCVVSLIVSFFVENMMVFFFIYSFRFLFGLELSCMFFLGWVVIS